MANHRDGLTVISLEHFTVLKENRCLVAEASDFRGKDLFKRIYDDAIDVGFIIRSHHTGREVLYAWTSENKDFDGEITGWNFEPIALDVDWAVTIFND